MRDLLDSIEAALDRAGRVTTLRRLRPGLGPEDVRQRFGALGLTAPEDLARVYAWHDGTDAGSGAPLDDLHMFPGLYLLSLRDAATNYEAFRDDGRWNPAWLPVFANGGGDFLAVVCDETRAQWGNVVHFRIDEADHPVEFASVGRLLATVVAAYVGGICFVDDRGYLELDDLAFGALAGRLNPDVEYWRR
jgi:cell wall assembly regulator SMI1